MNFITLLLLLAALTAVATIMIVVTGVLDVDGIPQSDAPVNPDTRHRLQVRIRDLESELSRVEECMVRAAGEGNSDLSSMYWEKFIRTQVQIAGLQQQLKGEPEPPEVPCAS